ncbi:Integrase catalytic domain-containing protein [Abeliophyllum distichum]|uniref:Integrase catalytic domain-containing protein n=1 Tax=Abeliophyllum distichum TaxID=126358 RepID=A0ABD1TKZ3_9LAMI
MAKAYDHMDWGFLIPILEGFGFDALWIDQIWRCISECRFSVLLNCKPCDFFSSSRGLKQDYEASQSYLEEVRGFAKFFWDSRDHAHRLHWRRWKDLCIPTEDGGLRLQDFVDTFSIKLWWLFRS